MRGKARKGTNMSQAPACSWYRNRHSTTSTAITTATISKGSCCSMSGYWVPVTAGTFMFPLNPHKDPDKQKLLALFYKEMKL